MVVARPQPDRGWAAKHAACRTRRDGLTVIAAVAGRAEEAILQCCGKTRQDHWQRHRRTDDRLVGEATFRALARGPHTTRSEGLCGRCEHTGIHGEAEVVERVPV